MLFDYQQVTNYYSPADYSRHISKSLPDSIMANQTTTNTTTTDTAATTTTTIYTTMHTTTTTMDTATEKALLKEYTYQMMKINKKKSSHSWTRFCMPN